jgi:hypothetical protein
VVLAKRSNSNKRWFSKAQLARKQSLLFLPQRWNNSTPFVWWSFCSGSMVYDSCGFRLVSTS